MRQFVSLRLTQYLIPPPPQGWRFPEVFYGYVKVDLLVSRNLEVCRQVLEATVKDMGMDYQKVELLTAIVWLNMSPLHTYPLDVFLYYFGKYNLYRCLRSQGLLIQG